MGKVGSSSDTSRLGVRHEKHLLLDNSLNQPLLKPSGRHDCSCLLLPLSFYTHNMHKLLMTRVHAVKLIPQNLFSPGRRAFTSICSWQGDNLFLFFCGLFMLSLTFQINILRYNVFTNMSESCRVLQHIVGDNPKPQESVDSTANHFTHHISHSHFAVESNEQHVRGNKTEYLTVLTT